MDAYLSGALIYVNSAALSHVLSGALCNASMRTVEEVRRLRLAELVDELGSYVALNSKLGRSVRDSTLSQVVNRSLGTKTKKPKVMGSAQARRIEKVCGKPVGWMDTDPDFDEATWPFGEDVSLTAVRSLPEHLRHQAIGALNAIVSQQVTLSKQLGAPIDPEHRAALDKMAENAEDLDAESKRARHRASRR